MKFIIAEQFKDQPEEVQKVFLDWWQPEMYDLYWYSFNKENEDGFILSCTNWEQITAIEKLKYKTIPILTEGQLRKFIEDKTGGTLDVVYINESTPKTYCIKIYKAKESILELYITAKDLLNAYWRAACSIANDILQEYWEKSCKIAEEEVDG